MIGPVVGSVTAAARPAPPLDLALPQRDALMSVEAVRPALRRSVGDESQVERTRVMSVSYRPGRRIAVHYEVWVNGRRHDAVVRAAAGVDLARRVEKPRYRRFAARVAARAPAKPPVFHDPGLNAIVSWLPFDVDLPALAEEPRALAGRLDAAGIHVGRPPHDVVRLPGTYRPGARLVLRLGDLFLKAYGKDRHFEAAATGFAVGRSMPFPTPPLEAAFADVRLTVQRAVPGAAPDPADAAFRAGAVVRRLQGVEAAPAISTSPSAVLELAAEKATLAGALLPGLASRVEALLRRLRGGLPADEPLVLAHGDFDVEQLLEAEGELVVLDLDDVRLAPPALDLATYLADLIVRGTDEATLATVLGRLIEGYGGRPAGLGWYVAAVTLSRAPQPFQRVLVEWPERIEAVVGAAEEALAA